MSPGEQLNEHLWPLLGDEHLIGSSKLVRLSLTLPGSAREHDLRTPARTFVELLADEGDQGTLLAIDVSDKGRWHLFGIALLEDGEEALELWLRIAGADLKGSTQVTVNGWMPFAKTGGRTHLIPNLHRILHYTFKPWPSQHGKRDLLSDVFASGTLTPVWARTVRDLRSAGLLNPTCPWCNGAMVDRRRGACWCSAACRKAASHGRLRSLGNEVLGAMGPFDSTAVAKALYRKMKPKGEFTFERALKVAKAFGWEADDLRQLLHELVVEDGVLRRTVEPNRACRHEFFT